MSPVLVCAGCGEGGVAACVWAELGCSPLSPLSSVCVPGRVSAARNVKVAPRLQPPVPSSDTQYSRVLQLWPPCTWYSQCFEILSSKVLMVKRSSLFWILWIKSFFADEGINSESFKHAQYWLELESLMSFLPSLVNNNVKMGELYNIDTTQACPSTAPT